MKKLTFTVHMALLTAAALLLAPLAVAQSASSKGEQKAYELSVRAQKADATYAVGQTVTFAIALSGGEQIPASVEADWKISKDSLPPFTEGKVTLENGKGKVSGTLDEPGFLYCEVWLTLDGKKVRAAAGAAIDPRKIEALTIVPEDFDAFWQAQKDALAQIPMNIRLTPLPKFSTDKIAVFDLQADSVEGVPVSGILSYPRDAKKGSLPAIITLHGAGVASASFNKYWAENGFIALDINAHGLPNGKPRSFYTDLNKGKLRRYVQFDRDNREKTYMKNMFLRVIRGIDALTAQPQWDGKTLVAYGSSQGAAQSIFAGGMDDRVSFVVGGVPAMTELASVPLGRASGSWWWLETDADRENEKMIETSRYFDTVNFARRSKAAAFFTVGFIDRTCKPTPVYAMFNTWPNPQKDIFNDIETGHRNSPEAGRKMRAAVREHVESQKKGR